MELELEPTQVDDMDCNGDGNGNGEVGTDVDSDVDQLPQGSHRDNDDDAVDAFGGPDSTSTIAWEDATHMCAYMHPAEAVAEARAELRGVPALRRNARYVKRNAVLRLRQQRSAAFVQSLDMEAHPWARANVLESCRRERGLGCVSSKLEAGECVLLCLPGYRCIPPNLYPKPYPDNRSLFF
jgi:hypothetical protein